MGKMAGAENKNSLYFSHYQLIIQRSKGQNVKRSLSSQPTNTESIGSEGNETFLWKRQIHSFLIYSSFIAKWLFLEFSISPNSQAQFNWGTEINTKTGTCQMVKWPQRQFQHQTGREIDVQNLDIKFVRKNARLTRTSTAELKDC